MLKCTQKCLAIQLSLILLEICLEYADNFSGFFFNKNQMRDEKIEVKINQCQFSFQNYCYFYTEIEDKCILCVIFGSPADSAFQAYNASPLPNATPIHYKHELHPEKVYVTGQLIILL